MKKVISILLSSVMALSVFSICAFAEEKTDLKFALASDLHYKAPHEELEFISEHPVYWYANRRLALEDESGFIIDEFLEQCAEDDSIEYVLISGDLADDGKTRAEDHRVVAGKLKAFEERTGKDVYVINGNHDNGINCSTTTETFREIYADFGYDKALETVKDDCSYTADLGEKYRLIALDSNDPSKSTEDGMSLKKINWVKKQADKAKKDGRYPILMMHHNLIDHMPLQRLINRNFIVRFHNTTASLFADMGIKLVMTGHEHCSDAAVFTSAAGNKIYDLATTSLTMYPLQYRVVDFNDNEINYNIRTVDGIDLDALTSTVSGYTDAQLTPMAAGLNEYSKGFAKQGLKYRLALSLTMEKMGIKESDFYYDLVKTAVDGLTDLLEKPFYGENSVSALASEYHITLPETDYENGWDLAGELVCSHYAGGETRDTSSPDVSLLLKTVSLILKSDLADVNDEIFLKAANELIKKNGGEPVTAAATKLCGRVFGGIRPGEYFITALIAPFLYEFAFDTDNVDDNCGTMEGYGTVSAKNNASNVLDNMKNIIDKMITYTKLFFTVTGRMFSK